MDLRPEQSLHCLLIHPKFSAFSFWNYTTSAELMGAKAPSPPLGLITVAALLPQQWQFRLLDLNTRDFSEADWQWADLVCVGGMLPQQTGILEIIRRAKEDGKYVVVGGPDPTSQPEVYSAADALVLGEGEDSIPRWLRAWGRGRSHGIFREEEKPDVTKSPLPRFDLLRLEDYVQIGVQYSRGCPFNCEFCDIIELFGRKPRVKLPEQLLAELAALKDLGYSGSIDIVDDNFIGNIRKVKRELLPALIAWNEDNGYPFYYATEASMNMADDTRLLELMQQAEFRIVFMGIETPDTDLLLMTQKSQNTVGSIVDRVRKLYDYGMVVTAGFIMGFDGEKPGMDLKIVKLIEATGINMAMAGLLVALPGTQLTRRLLKEGRLLSFRGEPIKSEADMFHSAQADQSKVEVVDQTVAGLNFVTSRPRSQILTEYQTLIREIFSPESYFQRVRSTGRALKMKSKYRPRSFAVRRQLKGLLGMVWYLGIKSSCRGYFWRNFLGSLVRGVHNTEQVMRVMGIYLHFQKQSEYLVKMLDRQLMDLSGRVQAGKSQTKGVIKPSEISKVPSPIEHDQLRPIQ